MPACAADALAWRYGLGDWARYGPASQPAALHDGSGGGGSSLQHVLVQQAHNLEAHLHGGLMRAFLGPP